jgi:hypothetical protein
MEMVSVGPAVAAAIGHGRVLTRGELGVEGPDPGPWAVLGTDGELLAVYEAHRDERVKPAVVLRPAASGTTETGDR